MRVVIDTPLGVDTYKATHMLSSPLFLSLTLTSFFLFTSVNVVLYVNVGLYVNVVRFDVNNSPQ